MVSIQRFQKDWHKYKFSAVDPWHFGTDSDPAPGIRRADLRIRIRLFSSVAFKMPKKNNYCLLQYSNIKTHKESQNSRSQGFSSFFYLMMLEGSWSGPQHCIHKPCVQRRMKSRRSYPIITDFCELMFLLFCDFSFKLGNSSLFPCFISSLSNIGSNSLPLPAVLCSAKRQEKFWFNSLRWFSQSWLAGSVQQRNTSTATKRNA